MEISDSVNLAKKEISSVFEKREEKLATDTDDGFVGDVAGICPVCGKNVVRNRYGYGCEGYMEGCKFFVGNIICGRVISISNMRQLLKTGKTYKIEGFVSKRTGKKFDAQLRLDNGRAVFDF